jgi:hypothetical protein
LRAQASRPTTDSIRFDVQSETRCPGTTPASCSAAASASVQSSSSCQEMRRVLSQSAKALGRASAWPRSSE